MRGPRIAAIAAVTLDGKIAHSSTHFTDWTSKEDKAFLGKELDRSDLVVVGHNTYRIAQAPLSRRRCLVLSRQTEGVERRSEKLFFCNPAHTCMADLLTPYTRVAVLGGTQVYTYFLENNLLDVMYITIEPLIFGRGLPLFESEEFFIKKMHLSSVNKLGVQGSILLKYTKTNTREKQA